MAFGRNRASVARPTTGPSQARSDPWSPGDHWLQPLPAPEVHEGGESMWDDWQEELRRMDLAFADTQPSEPIPLSGDTAGVSERPRIGVRWSAGEVIVMARRNNRACPRPFLWSALYVLLEGERYADLPPPPVQPWASGKLSNLQRRAHFRKYIQWADRHDKLETLARYLDSLSEPDWVHMGES